MYIYTYIYIYTYNTMITLSDVTKSIVMLLKVKKR